jgi:hypothetical protein
MVLPDVRLSLMVNDSGLTVTLKAGFVLSSNCGWREMRDRSSGYPAAARHLDSRAGESDVNGLLRSIQRSVLAGDVG